VVRDGDTPFTKFVPDIVPLRITLWAAASPMLSHVFLLIGATIVTLVALRLFGLC
jgi:hypothetical protein